MKTFSNSTANTYLSSLLPIESQQRMRHPGSGKGQLLYMAEDFNATIIDDAVATFRGGGKGGAAARLLIDRHGWENP